MPRNPHAVALGRRGGKARAKLQPSELSRIGQTGGRPLRYRVTAAGELQRLDGDHWLALEPPYDAAAKAFIRRQK